VVPAHSPQLCSTAVRQSPASTAAARCSNSPPPASRAEPACSTQTLREPLPFPNETFDIVIASLVMHYLPDWHPTLSEFHRVLSPGGRLVISTHHPFMDHPLAGGSNYFATYDFTETWQRGDQPYRCASGTAHSAA
jgi:SAM-dependent methyltransferase